MKKLKRGLPPTCLQGKLSDRTLSKKSIWLELNKMQHGFCAYCERKLNDKKHIEHFVPKRDDKKLEHEWENLFGSCGNSTQPWDSCGIFKDEKARPYNFKHLIKPDVESPDKYLKFSSTGTVKPKPNLNGLDLEKAQETIRVFNLNKCIKLAGARKSFLKKQLPFVNQLIKEHGFTLEDAMKLINNSESTEFSTALTQLLAPF
tara:strand:+ start:136 stop:744 length:609 start_codon:yes stop_codon:yes gene_type:complete